MSDDLFAGLPTSPMPGDEPREIPVIKVEIPLDAVLGYHRVNVGDDEYESYPGTVLDEILDRSAHLIVDAVVRRVNNDELGYDGFFSNYVKPKLDAILQDKVNEILSKKVTKTNTYGEPVGNEAPLQEWVEKRVEEWLTTRPRVDSYRGVTNPSPLENAVEQFEGREMRASLDKVLVEARKAALSAFTRVAEVKLTEALRESLAAVAK